jgi:hypothetical protein
MFANAGQAVQALLTALEAKCGAGNFAVSGGAISLTVTFIGTYAETDVPQMTCTMVVGPEGSCNVSAEVNGSANALLPASAADATSGLAVDSDSDGPGSDEDVLYVLRDPAIGNTVVQQVGPLNDPGLAAAPTAADERHGADAGFTAVQGLGLSEPSGRLFVSATNSVGGAGSGHREYILDETVPQAITVDSIDGIFSTGANINGTINANAPTSYPNSPNAGYFLEFKLSSASTWEQYGTSANVGSGDNPIQFSKLLAGLRPNSQYDVRLVATRLYSPPVVSATESFQTLPAPPRIESFTSSNLTKTSVDLSATINPLGVATEYRFEYGPTTNYGSSVPIPSGALPASHGGQPVTVHVENLQSVPYHFRVVAINELGEESLRARHAQRSRDRQSLRGRGHVS